MQGLMQPYSLTLDRILDHAAEWHGRREVVTWAASGRKLRSSYREVRLRAMRFSNALRHLGVVEGDRVATLAWNTIDHVEAWYGIMGLGAVCHTLNPRLFLDQIAWIIDHAEDRLLVVSPGLLPLARELAARCPSIEAVIVLRGGDEGAETGPALHRYDDLIEDREEEGARWGAFGEEAAAGLCYTSGTTGDPKGVLYSHRSNYLHALTSIQPDMLGLRATDTVLPLVPMFHANAWGLVFSCPAVGAKLVLPGDRLDGASVSELINSEGVTFAAAVPTVWQDYVNYLKSSGERPAALDRVLIGGAAVPEGLVCDLASFGVRVIHAWGMTEASPIGTVNADVCETAGLEGNERSELTLKQGRPPLGVSLALKGDESEAAPRDGAANGRLMIRGHSIARAYFRQDTPILDAEGWFDTGDIARIDPLGFMQITDRAKDVIKSGGEWISSMDIENIAASHAEVTRAAVIGVPHEKWGERPLLILVCERPSEGLADEIRTLLSGKIAKWWIPDEIRFADAIPLGATGKIDKKALRLELLAS